jgi:hypothetical protein
MRADRGNRVLLTLIGLIVLAIGIGGLLAAGGVFGATFQHRRLFDNPFSRYFSDNGSWLWPTIAAAAFVVMLLCLIWLLRVLFGSDRAGDIAVPTIARSSGDPAHGDGVHVGGRTRLRPSALTQALTQEIETYHGVTAARARVLGDPLEPTLAVEVTTSRRADVAYLVQRIEHEALAHARQALDKPHLPVRLDITVTDKAAARSG